MIVIITRIIAIIYINIDDSKNDNDINNNKIVLIQKYKFV